MPMPDGASNERPVPGQPATQEATALRAALLDGANSAPTTPADAAYFSDLRNRCGVVSDPSDPKESGRN